MALGQLTMLTFHSSCQNFPSVRISLGGQWKYFQCTIPLLFTRTSLLPTSYIACISAPSSLHSILQSQNLQQCGRYFDICRKQTVKDCPQERLVVEEICPAELRWSKSKKCNIIENIINVSACCLFEAYLLSVLLFCAYIVHRWLNIFAKYCVLFFQFM